MTLLHVLHTIPFPMRHSRNASNSGRMAGPLGEVNDSRKITLKGIRVSELEAYNFIFLALRSDTFQADITYYSDSIVFSNYSFSIITNQTQSISN